MTLRNLRLWHWRQVLEFRRQADEMRKLMQVTTARHCDKLANFHLGIVQLLNDSVDGTAEDDFIKFLEQISAGPNFADAFAFMLDGLKNDAN